MTIDLRDPTLAAASVTEALGLAPHPEGGWFRETWRDSPAGERGVGTGILFLLAAGERSHWHRVDAVELWVWQGGAPLRLGIADADGRRTLILGPDLTAGETLQAVVPIPAWQEAASLGAWSLVGCMVAPAFDFAGFELAPIGWSPPAGGAQTSNTTPWASGRVVP